MGSIVASLSSRLKGVLDPSREMLSIRAARISLVFSHLELVERPREFPSVVQNFPDVEMSLTCSPKTAHS
jgi:hypothetical protein